MLRPYDNHNHCLPPLLPSQLTSYYGFLCWLVEGEAQGHHGSHLQDDERHVLQCLPYQRQEGLRGLRRDDIGAESLSPMLHVTGIPTQPCNGRNLVRCACFSPPRPFFFSPVYLFFLLYIFSSLILPILFTFTFPLSHTFRSLRILLNTTEI